MKVIYFDSDCFYCNSFVIFLMSKNSEFKFATLSHSRLETFRETHPRLDSVVYEDDGKFFVKSNAIVRILKELGHFYKIIAFFYWLIPVFLRDLEYDLFAKYRYKLSFGAKCRIFSDEEKNRILDG